MKRFIYLAGLTGLLCISGCSSGLPSAAPRIDKSFSAEIEIKAGKELLKGTISRTAENCWELYVTEPFALEGLTVTLDSESTHYTMMGYEAEADISSEAVSAVRLLSEAFEAAAEGTGVFSDNAFTGTNANGGYTVTVDGKGQPSGISLEGSAVSAELSEWAELEEKAEYDEEENFIIE